MRPTYTLAVALLTGLCFTVRAAGQEAQPTAPAPSGAGPVAIDPTSPVAQAFAATQKTRVELERDLYRIRAKYFRNIRNTQIRQAGIAKLRDFTDPAIFPSFLKIFAREKDDVRFAILDHLADIKSEHADATLAWAAVHGRDSLYRSEASNRLIHRARETGEPSFYVKSVIAEALKSGNNDEMASAAQLAQVLRLFEAIPMLINAQVTGTTTGVGETDETALAYILVGQQQAFVADLTPVVGDSAVAFDPTVAVVTEGVVLRVIDAVVFTYRVEVHNSLVALSSDAWGRSTAHLGWDNEKWREWYVKELVPHLARTATPPPGPR